MSKLALGTAQFGLEYGINNHRGMIPDGEIAEILNLAAAKGIDTLDSAPAYGDSEERIGRYLAGSNKSFRIISKSPKGTRDPLISLAGSLKALMVDSIYGYLLHDFRTYTDNPGIWDILLELKAQGKVKKIGLSLYYPAELEKALDDGLRLDLVQVPYNLFDRRFECYFERLKKLGIEVHVRSVFLQGLFFKEIATLSPYFDLVKDKLIKLKEIAGNKKHTLLRLILGFVLNNSLIDKVVVGVDSFSNLKEILMVENAPHRAAFQQADFDEMRVDDESIILPFNWNKRKSHVK